jgi:MFS family permease
MNAEVEEQAQYPSAGRAWWAVIVFYLAYTLAFIDRQIMAFLVGPIRADLHLTDFQFSLIQGLAFVLFYSGFGIPIARLADRYSRRRIVVFGIAFWSVMTTLCGLAGNYWQLFAARLGVGMGEATLSPAAVSMISDLFPKDRRALPISLYAAGVNSGAAMANIFGGMAVGFAMSGGAATLPLLGTLKSWQLAFVLVGLPGLLVALLGLTFREPARHDCAAAHHTVGDLFAYLNRHRVAYGCLIVGASFAAMATFGAFSWVPALYARRFGWGPARIGPWMGLITLVCGVGGLLLGGYIAGLMVQKKVSAPFTKIMVFSMSAAIVPAMALLWIDDPYRMLGCLALLVLCLSTPPGLAQAAIQAITPNGLRAQMIAVYLLAVALIGSGLGPSSIAAMTDFYFHDDAAVGSSIAIVATAAALLSVIILSLGRTAWARAASEKLTQGA